MYLRDDAWRVVAEWQSRLIAETEAEMKAWKSDLLYEPTDADLSAMRGAIFERLRFREFGPRWTPYEG